ncbi:MAG: PHP domain-containing protein [Ruminococcaceae bacterium]|nr:PHP domain-containing protein [Oscillospiraceae bacterium]
MKKFLLPKEGNFYKANLHCHSNNSDGRLSPEEIKKIYKEKGYSIVAYTDHDILLDHQDLKDDTFLPLNGFEIEVNEDKEGPFCLKKSSHMCLIALDEDNLIQPCYHRTKYLFGNAPNLRDQIKYDETLPDFERQHNSECVSEIMQTGREKGFFVTYNHPTWSLDDYMDYTNYSGMHAMEICNYGSMSFGYDEYNEKEYDDLLRCGKRIYAIGADDNHNKRDDAFGAFTMIKADKLEYKTITNALVDGNFYASQGPKIYELYFEDGKIYVKCSNAKMIRLNTAIRVLKYEKAEDDKFVNEACFEIEKDYGYVRITVVDENGKHANTNAYFTDELFK